MKKITVILLSLFMLSACMSSRNENTLTPQEQQITSDALIAAMKAALVSTENTLFTETIDYSLDQSFQPYLRDLPQFRRTAAEYLDTATTLLHSALRPVTDSIVSYLDTFTLEDPEGYLDRGYSSVSAELEARLREQTRDLFLSYLDENSRELDLVYASLQYEADIWRNNLSNLSLVGQGETIENIVPISNDDLADYATMQFFSALAEAEVNARTTGRTL